MQKSMVTLDPVSLVKLGSPQPFLIITTSRGLAATTTIVKHTSLRNREPDISLRDPRILDGLYLTDDICNINKQVSKSVKTLIAQCISTRKRRNSLSLTLLTMKPHCNDDKL